MNQTRVRTPAHEAALRTLEYGPMLVGTSQHTGALGAAREAEELAHVDVRWIGDIFIAEVVLEPMVAR